MDGKEAADAGQIDTVRWKNCDLQASIGFLVIEISSCNGILLQITLIHLVFLIVEYIANLSVSGITIIVSMGVFFSDSYQSLFFLT